MGRTKLNFILGLILGLGLMLVIISFDSLSLSSTGKVIDEFRHAHQWSRMFDNRGHGFIERIHGDAAVGGESVKAVKFDDLHAHHDDDSVAKDMANHVRVLVWVMTSPQNLDKKAIHVQNTWGKRANTLLFMSSKWNSSFPTIGLNVSEGRQHLTAKTMQAFRYVYEHHFDDADWFMKADDDTYVIMENLRYMLSGYSSKDPIYFGHIFKAIVKQGYASGGAGYVISKEALRRFAAKGMNNATVCQDNYGVEDADIGQCLMNLGVKLMPTVDRLGRSRFHCFLPESHIIGSYPPWYLEYDANGAKSGIEEVSDYPITFHYVSPGQMYTMEYFVYHLRPYGIISRPQSLNLLANLTVN